MDKWVRFLANTGGRDKFYRTVQYASKLLAYYLAKVSVDSEYVKRLLALSMAVGQGRKLFRIGKPLDHILLIDRIIKREKDDLARNLLITKSIGFGGWLLLDSIQWLNSAKVLKLEGGLQVINDLAPRLWLTGLIASLLYNLYRAECHFKDAFEEGKIKDMSSGLVKMAKYDPIFQSHLLDALQDLLDMCIPLTLSNMYPFSQGTVGLAGTITSLMGARSLWPN